MNLLFLFKKGSDSASGCELICLTILLVMSEAHTSAVSRVKSINSDKLAIKTEFISIQVHKTSCVDVTQVRFSQIALWHMMCVSRLWNRCIIKSNWHHPEKEEKREKKHSTGEALVVLLIFYKTIIWLLFHYFDQKHLAFAML